MSIEAIIFDWGGTLSRWADIDLADMWQVAAEHLARETPHDVNELRDALIASEQRYWEGVNASQHTGTLGDILAQASVALGLDVATAVISEAAQRHLDAWTPHIQHHADAAPTLQRLRERGVKLALLSNTHWPEAFHERFLERDGLAALLDVRAYTSNMQHSKPHPEAFRHVLSRLAVEPAHAVMVGDRPIDDVRGAQRVGMRGIWRPHSTAPALGDVVPDATIQRLDELPDLIATW
ncbi:MAG: HAD family hydrolase [Polyangiales bacterium]